MSIVINIQNTTIFVILTGFYTSIEIKRMFDIKIKRMFEIKMKWMFDIKIKRMFDMEKKRCLI